jgi:beta-N-acetylhexosaminidase
MMPLRAHLLYVGAMTLRIGELFLLGFRGTRLPAWLIDFERAFGLGGVLLFDRDVQTGAALRNVESPAQLRALCDEVHALPSRPLVCIDQEGGRVRRLKPERGFAELPSARAFARLDAAEARRLAEASFAEMKSLGIDFDLAPVVDLDVNPANPNIGALERSFSADPAVVRRCVLTLDAAARRVGLGLCLKHYPGLGGAWTDSHAELTDISACVSDAEVALFVELAAQVAGSAILLSHGMAKQWDPAWPVSISAAAIGALRRALPDALLITDDLQMQGLRAFCSTLEAARRALAAGVDLVCIGNNLLAEEGECVQAAASLAALAERDATLRSTLLAAQARVRARKASCG